MPLKYDGAGILAWQMRSVGLPEPRKEYVFHPTRKWRADFCWPESKLIVEYHGGIYANGRHTRGKGFEVDREKMNAAQLMGYRVLEFTASHVRSGYALKAIEEALGE